MDKSKESKTTDTKAAKAETTAAAKKAQATETKAETKAEAKEAKAETKTAAKKTAAKKTTAAKKATAAKTTTKAATTKKAAAKKEDIDTSVAVQFGGKEVFTANLVEDVKKAWVEQFEGKLSEIKTIELYIKPEEMRAYFVVNGLSNGNYFIDL